MSGPQGDGRSAKLCMRRRDLLAAILGSGSVAAAGCRDPKEDGWLDRWWSGPLPPAGELLSPNFQVGHQIPAVRPEVSSGGPTELLDCVIVGGGVAGLSAARQLLRRGVTRFQVLELESVAGGTARSGDREGFEFPWGAHYLPVPMSDNQPLLEFLSECGIVESFDPAGPVRVGEQHLCRDPEERVFAEGRWTLGVWPDGVASAEDVAQRDRFRRQMIELGQRRGSDGRRWFAIPTSLTTSDPVAVELLRKWDAESMSQWMKHNGYDSPVLRWLVDHACRDDYGLSIEQASGWAGLFYFASRIADASGTSQPVMTWPSGNGRLVDALADRVGDRLRCGRAVLKVKIVSAGNTTSGRVELDVLDVKSGERRTLTTRRVILAIPHFITRHLIPATHLAAEGRSEGGPAGNGPPSFQYGAWWVANVILSDRPSETDGTMCWDNIAYRSGSLGYVNATHQLGADYGPTVLTWYHAVTEDMPQQARRELLQMTWADAAEVVLSDLERMHPDIRSLVTRLDVMRWGHAMIQPRVGVFTSAMRQQLSRPRPPLHFANTDLSGVALFEEAFDHGARAADEVANVLNADDARR